MLKNIKISQLQCNTGQIDGLPKNPRTIKDARFEALKKSIEDAPEMLNLRELLVFPHNDKFVVIGGNMRLKACRDLGFKELPCKVLDENTPVEKLREYAIKDNIGFGADDWDALGQDWDFAELEGWGMELPEFKANEEEKTPHEKLSDKFIAPPFTIWDTRQGYWSERQSFWKSLINDNGESREATLSEAELMTSINNGVSILNPVMAELICKWFGIQGGTAFDCFAGDSVFGFVSSFCGMNFTGIELREEQVKLNTQRTEGMSAKYICDDGQNVLNHIEENSQDLFFSCPPYFDLEVYSNKPNDASNQETYEDFLRLLKNAFVNSLKCLKNNRFAVVVIGDVRSKQGFYLDMISDIKKIFINAGVCLYNEAILVEPLGTLPQRVARHMKYRKLGKCHQNILIFYKGDIKEIPNNYKEIDYECGDME